MPLKHLPYRIRHRLRSIHCWFKVSFNRQHLRMARTAFESYPFDYSDLLDIERDKLREMLAYFRKGHIATQETYAHTIRYVALAIKMIDIMNGDATTFHFDGDLKDTELEEKDEKGELLYSVDTSELIYHCDVKVNLHNIDRFVQNDSMKDICTKYPHELYKLKAKHLYYRIRLLHTEEWWD